MSIDHNIYNEITCEETHILQPFSNQESGATTFVRQNLILTEETQGPTTDEEQDINLRVPLYFDHTIPLKPTSNDNVLVKNLVKKLCSYNYMQDVMEVSDIFSKFIYNLKIISSDALNDLYKHIGAVCPTGR